MFRIGYQFEQRGFHRLRYPLCVWGGGVAVRRSLEAQITWDARTVTEDTSFIWRAARETGITYRLVDTRFRNQTPPSGRSMIRQRHRWLSGSLADDHRLPRRYRPLYVTRVVVWGFSPLVPLLVAAAYLLPGSAPSPELCGAISTALLALLFVYMLAGLVAYRSHLLA